MDLVTYLFITDYIVPLIPLILLIILFIGLWIYGSIQDLIEKIKRKKYNKTK